MCIRDSTEWAKRNNLKLNLAKTHEIIFVDRKRKQKAPEPVEISQLHRVKVIKIPGVTITNGLSVLPHVQSVIVSCAQVLYAFAFVSCVPTVYAIVHCILSIDLLSLPNSSMHLVPGRVLPTLQIRTNFNRSSTRVKEMDTVHPIYLILIICAPQ